MYATVDTGSTYTCLPADLLRDLGIVPCRRIRSELADGSIVEDDLAIVHVRVEGVYIPTPAIFANGGAPALLGAYTLEGACWWLTQCASGWRQPTRCGMASGPCKEGISNGPYNK